MRNTLDPGSLPSLSTDIHTHLTGAPRSRELVRLGHHHDLRYPAAMLQLAGVPLPEGVRLVDQDTLVLPGGVAVAAADSPTIRLRDLPVSSLMALTRAMEVPSVPAASAANETFLALERAYSIRRPLATHQLLLPEILGSVAEDARHDGVTHLELSSSAPLLDPPRGGQAWLDTASQAAADIHRRMGIRILLLATANRHAPPHALSRALARLDDLMAAYPFLVGVDIAGHETNPTADFMPSVMSWAACRVRQGLPVVVRVHAGETPLHPTNVRVALEGFSAIGLPPGMGRIGHALHGLGRREVALARETGSVVEMGLTSNQALGYRTVRTDSGGGARLARLIGSGVAAVLGTDGAGIYRTGPAVEVRLALRDGASLSTLTEVRRHEERHIERMRETFPSAFAA